MEEFLAEAFSANGKIWLSSLPNVRGTASEQHVLTRDVAKMKKFVREWDIPGRGTFYCVSTQRGKRSKENFVDTLMVHVDIDLKSVDLDEAEILSRLDGLDRPPSRVHGSGHGLHALWLLDQPASDPERVEAVLRKMRAALAGDKMVAQSVALMRLPGTTNSKREPREVTVLRSSEARYALEDLEDWELSTVILEKGRDQGDPFTRMAEEYGFVPPIDADARLAAMTHQGDGDSGIHTTQLSVTASLMSRGMEEDEIVAKVLEATRAAVGSVRWNWRKEEEAIRGMCRDWAAKEDRKVERKTGTGKVVSLAAARDERKVKKKDVHVILARGILKDLDERGESILFTQGQLWHYAAGRWRLVPAGEEKDWIDRMVERGCRALNVTSKSTLVNETRQYIRRDPALQRESVDWDAHGKIATRSGLLDPKDLSLEPHRAEHMTTRWIDCEFVARARCPWFLKMLDALFDAETIGLLQEVMGSFLLDNRPRPMRRALVLVGGSNTGKSSLIAVMSEFFGKALNPTSLEMLENAHGLMPFLEPRPWVLHEAFELGKWHFSANVKALLSADPIGVNIKNGPLMHHTFRQPVLWGTNVPPQFRESTKAMQNRLLIVECNRVFEGSPTGAALEASREGFASMAEFILAREHPGLLRWALDGLERLQARGEFDVPRNTLEGMHEMFLQSNLVAGFVEECVEFDETSMVATPDFCGAFRIWWEESRGDQIVPSNQAIGMAFKALGSRADVGHLRDKKWRYFGGVKLNEKGLDLWQGFSSSRRALEGGVRLSSGVSDVNRKVSSLSSRTGP